MSPFALTVWLNVQKRYEAGDPKVTSAARRMAEEALGVTFVRAGKGQRPDFADRAAADDSFGDGMVVL